MSKGLVEVVVIGKDGKKFNYRCTSVEISDSQISIRNLINERINCLHIRKEPGDKIEVE